MLWGAIAEGSVGELLLFSLGPWKGSSGEAFMIPEGNTFSILHLIINNIGLNTHFENLPIFKCLGRV